jgi:hypothetical protein
MNADPTPNETDLDWKGRLRWLLVGAYGIGLLSRTYAESRLESGEMSPACVMQFFAAVPAETMKPTAPCPLFVATTTGKTAPIWLDSGRHPKRSVSKENWIPKSCYFLSKSALHLGLVQGDRHAPHHPQNLDENWAFLKARSVSALLRLDSGPCREWHRRCHSVLPT